MKRDPHVREPRSQVIFRHTREALRQSGLTMQVLATAIADRYQEQVSPGERIVEFHVGTTADSIVRAHKANLQLVARWLDGKVKLPADLEESWVASLPESHRLECERELAQRYGFLGARIPEHAGAAPALSIAGVSIEFGHLLLKLGKVLADNQVTAEDLPDLLRADKEAGDLQAELATLRETLATAIVAGMSTNVVPHLRGSKP